MLGRSNLVDEAEQVHNAIQKPDYVAMMTLLGSYRLHRHVDRAKR